MTIFRKKKERGVCIACAPQAVVTAMAAAYVTAKAAEERLMTVKVES